MMSMRCISAAKALSAALLLLLSLAAPRRVVALSNGLGLTPPMGYNAYDHVGCCANETTMKAAAEGLIKHGLDKLGYVRCYQPCHCCSAAAAVGTYKCVLLLLIADVCHLVARPPPPPSLCAVCASAMSTWTAVGWAAGTRMALCSKAPASSQMA
jgi:hypothetical protein